jgi:transposase
MEIRVIGIDLGKSVFHLVGMDKHGKVAARKRLSRSQMTVYTAKLPSCLIGMEACGGGHFLGAALTAQGHDVRLYAGTVRKAISEVQQERLP